MTVWAHDDILDAKLSYIKESATLMTVCSAAPTNRTEAVSTYALANVAISDTDFTISDSQGLGRLLTLAEKNGVVVATSGTMTHLALCDATRLLLVTEILTSQVLTAGNTLDLPELPILSRDPE